MALFGPPNVEQLKEKGRVKPLIKALVYKQDAGVRQAAAVALGELGDGLAVEALVEALQGKELRHEAAMALGSIGDVRAVDALLVSLRDADPMVRAASATALGEIGDGRAISGLIETFGDVDYSVREAAIAALQRMGAETEDLLRAAVKDSHSALREGAARALEAREWSPSADAAGAHYRIVRGEWDQAVEIGEPAVDPLIQALGRGDDTVSAIQALGRIGDMRAADPLCALVREGSEPARAAALEALGQMEAVGALNDMVTGLTDESAKVRTAAAAALGTLSVAQAVEPLIEALSDEAREVRAAAATALGQIGDPKAIEPLVAAFGDDGTQVRDAAEKALRLIDAPVEGALTAALCARQRVLRDRAARALEEREWQPTQDEAGAAYYLVRRRWEQVSALGVLALEPLLAALSDSWVSDEVVSALAAIGAPAVEGLLHELGAQEGAGKKAAINSLGQIADARAVESLVRVLQSDEALRQITAEALGRIGEPAVAPLVALLLDPEKQEDTSLRKAVATALAKCGQPAVDPLVNLLGDEALRETATDALIAAGPPAVRPLVAALADESRSEASRDTLAQMSPEALESLATLVGEQRTWSPDDLERLWQVAVRIKSAEPFAMVSAAMRGADGSAELSEPSEENRALVDRLLSHEQSVRDKAGEEVGSDECIGEDAALCRAISANRKLYEAIRDQDQGTVLETPMILCREALRLVSDFSAAMVACAMIYRRHAKKPEVALGWVMSALELVDEDAEMGAEGDNPHAWVELGEVRAALEDPVGATGVFMGATLVVSDLSDPTPYLRLVEVYRRLGMLDELYTAMAEATRLGADIENDLDPTWTTLVARTEGRHLRDVVTGAAESQDIPDNLQTLVSSEVWRDGEYGG